MTTLHLIHEGGALQTPLDHRFWIEIDLQNLVDSLREEGGEITVKTVLELLVSQAEKESYTDIVQRASPFLMPQ